MKRLFLLLYITLLISNCSSHRDIKSRENPIINIDNAYNLGDYTIILRTRDSVFLLSDCKVSPEGKMSGKINWIGDKDKLPLDNVESGNMVFESNKKSQFVVKGIYDSIENRRIARIEFSDATITKVCITGETKRENRKIYNKWDNKWDRIKSFLLILGVVLLVISLILTIVGIIFLISWISSGGPSAFGCFIATMVYGNYDAPEVMVLRKYRDDELAPYFLGRAFIRVYYALSPVFVKVFKNNEPVKALIKSILDRWVNKLIKKAG